MHVEKTRRKQSVDARNSGMGDESLIEAVRRFKCLCKVQSRAYRDLRAKENAWKAVAASQT